MNDIPLYAQTEAVYKRLEHLLNDSRLIEAIAQQVIPRPLLRPWQDNPHAATDRPRTANTNGGFRARPLPERIVIYPHLLSQPAHIHLTIPIHELFHGLAWQRCVFDHVRKYQVWLPPEVNEHGVHLVTELCDCPEEAWVIAREFLVVPDLASEALSIRLGESQKWRWQGHFPAVLLLKSLSQQYLFTYIARQLPSNCRALRTLCEQEAQTHASLRREFCQDLIRRYELARAIDDLLLAEDSVNYWPAYVALLTPLLGIKTQVDTSLAL